MSAKSPVVNARETPPTEVDETLGGILLPGTDSIGCGYDVFGRFADVDSVRRSLFDLGESKKFSTKDGTYYKPDSVTVLWRRGTNYIESSGTRMSEYQTELAGEVGLTGTYGFFEGSADVWFDRSHRRCAAFSFVSQIQLTRVATLRLDPNGDVRELLKPHVAHDLATMAPKTLFDTYGTHYLRGVVIGARMSYSAATNTTTYSGTTGFAQAARLAYEGASGQLSGHEKTRHRKTIEQFERSSRVHIEAVGGRSELLNGNTLDAKRFQQWIDSISDRMVFVSIPERGLEPVWELCADDDRKVELAEAFEEYARAPAPEPIVVPVYAYHAKTPPSRWYYSTNPDEKHGWRLHGGDEFTFYAATEPGEEERKPVWLQTAGGSRDDPERYKLSLSKKGTNKWSDGKRIAFYAYDERGPDRVPIYQYNAKKDSDHSGWHYRTERDVSGWNENGVAFWTDRVDGVGT